MTRGSRMRVEEASGIDGGVDAELRDLAREVRGGVEVGEGRGGRRVGVVVGGHVDRLHRGDRALLGGGDALLQLAHLRLQRRLVADGGGHAAEQRRHLRARLGEAEDVVDEEQHVLAFVVAEVLGHREAGEGDAQARAGRLRHLAVDERGLALLEVLEVDDPRLLELQPEVVALARALADAREHRDAAVLLGQVVDELLDDDGLADAGAAEQADLAAAQVGLDEVDDLDAGLEHLERRGLLLEGGGGAVDGVRAWRRLTGPSSSTGSPMTFSTRPSVPGPTGTEMGPPVSTAFMPRTMPSVGSMLTQRTRFSPRCCSTSTMTSIGTPLPEPSSVMRSALKMGGTAPSNSTSTTGPMIWTTRPTFSVAMAPLAASCCCRSFMPSPRSRHHLDDLLGDGGLAYLVHVQGETIDHLARVLGGGVHGRHARAVLGGLRTRGARATPAPRRAAAGCRRRSSPAPARRCSPGPAPAGSKSSLRMGSSRSTIDLLLHRRS